MSIWFWLFLGVPAALQFAVPPSVSIGWRRVRTLAALALATLFASLGLQTLFGEILIREDIYYRLDEEVWALSCPSVLNGFIATYLGLTLVCFCHWVYTLIHRRFLDRTEQSPERKKFFEGLSILTGLLISFPFLWPSLQVFLRGISGFAGMFLLALIAASVVFGVSAVKRIEQAAAPRLRGGRVLLLWVAGFFVLNALIHGFFWWTSGSRYADSPDFDAGYRNLSTVAAVFSGIVATVHAGVVEMFWRRYCYRSASFAYERRTGSWFMTGAAKGLIVISFIWIVLNIALHEWYFIARDLGLRDWIKAWIG